MTLPSKELWSAVIGKELPTHLKLFGTKDITAVSSGEMVSINAYELLHLMKKWLRKTHDANIVIDYNCLYSESTVITTVWIKGLTPYEEKASTEFEAVTKACEWILNETKKPKVYIAKLNVALPSSFSYFTINLGLKMQFYRRLKRYKLLKG